MSWSGSSEVKEEVERRVNAWKSLQNDLLISLRVASGPAYPHIQAAGLSFGCCADAMPQMFPSLLRQEHGIIVRPVTTHWDNSGIADTIAASNTVLAIQSGDPDLPPLAPFLAPSIRNPDLAIWRISLLPPLASSRLCAFRATFSIL